jgi:hypothetical protein
MRLIDAIVRAWPDAQCATRGDVLVSWDGPGQQPSDADIALAVDRHAAREPWDQLRAERNRRLTACDWTQVADSPLDDASDNQWRVYRQALRDLPQTQDDPANVVWPVAP